MLNKRKISLGIIISMWLGICTIGACRNPAENRVSLSNGKIRVELDSGSGALLNFRDQVRSFDFLEGANPGGSPWEIVIKGKSAPDTLNIFSATHFSATFPDSSTLVAEWSEFRGAGYRNLRVIATIHLQDNSSLSSWKISVDGIKGMEVGSVVFPRISGLKKRDDQNLAVPVWTGRLIKNPGAELAKIEKSEKKYVWGYPGLMSLQCVALYDSTRTGLYLSCNDSLAYSKDFTFGLDRNKSLVYELINYPSVDTALDTYSPAYEAVIGTFRGDWTTAAFIYREWGTRQKWCRESRVTKRLTPHWLESTALWVWNRGKSGKVLDPAADLKRRLGLPVNVFWHWWHGCSYDDGFPEYMPPREGKSSFISAMDRAKEQGIHAIVYMNQALWGTTTESWKNENAAEASAKDPTGNTIAHVFNKFTNKSAAYMCMGTQFWKDKYSSLCDNAVNEYRVNGVYMDMACLSLKCYDKSHGHQIGGGNYWIENFGRITAQIRSKVAVEKELVLAGEGCGEVWLPYLDAFLTLEMSKERYAGIGGWETIPFFQAVYHQFSITYGNYSSLTEPPYDELWPKEYAPAEPLKLLDKRYSKQFLMEQARSFVWGIQPTIANYRPELASERKEETDYLLEMARIRNLGMSYLLFGKFLPSPDMKIPEKETDISRLSIYAGKTGNTVTSFRDNFPLVYYGTWQREDKQTCMALASISDDPVRIGCSVQTAEYGLPQSGSVYLTDKTGRTRLQSYAGGEVVIDFQVPPMGICLLEIIPDQNQ